MGRSRILPRVVATISSAAFLFFVPSAVADVPSDLLRASAAFQKALRDANASALSAIVDDRFIWITADGAVFGKSDLLGQLRGHASQFGDLTSEQEAFRQYGNTAVVTGLETEASERRDDGRPSLYINVHESAPELESRCLPRGENCSRGRQAPSGAARLPCRCEAADPQRRRSRCYAFRGCGKLRRPRSKVDHFGNRHGAMSLVHRGCRVCEVASRSRPWSASHVYIRMGHLSLGARGSASAGSKSRRSGRIFLRRCGESAEACASRRGGDGTTSTD